MDRIRKPSALHELPSFPSVEFGNGTKTAEVLQPTNLERLQLLWDHRLLLRRVALWALVLSTLLAFIIPRRFKSEVSIMPPENLNNNATMLTAIAAKTSPQLAAMASNLFGSKSTGALFADLLHSRTVQDHIVDRFQLQKVYWERYREDARKKLDDRTSVTEDRKSGVISVEVLDHNAQRARDIAQAYVDELNQLLAQVSTSSARRERIFIEGRLITVKADLDDAEKKFGAFASKNTALDIKEQTKAMVQSAAELQGQLIAAQSQLQGLEQIYTGNNVRVKTAKAQVAELKHQLERIGGADVAANPEGAQSEDFYPSIKKLPLLGVEWADLYRRTKIEETVYELLNQQYELARMQEAKEIPTVNVIDPANYPEKTAFPPKILLIALATILSVVGAAAAVLISEKWQRVDPSDPRKIVLYRIGVRIQKEARRIEQWPLIVRLRKRRPFDSVQRR